MCKSLGSPDLPGPSERGTVPARILGRTSELTTCLAQSSPRETCASLSPTSVTAKLGETKAPSSS